MARVILRALAALLIVLIVLFAGSLVWPRPLPAPARAVAPAPLPTYGGDVPTPFVFPRPEASTPPPAAARSAALTNVAAPQPTDVATVVAQLLATASAAAPPPATPAPTAAPALAPPVAMAVNGVPYEAIVVMPPAVIAHVREIYAAGQALGRDPRAFSKVGDSTTENPHFLARFDEGDYNLGAYAHLQPVIDQFRGSYNRDSIAVRIGLHAWTANDPAWADPGLCLPNETPVACEIRVHNPSILFIRLGTNDVGVPETFAANIRQIVTTAINAGVVPIIGTKGDRHEGSNQNNDILRAIAAELAVPLWDYDRVADTLPGRGLDQDAAHMMTFFAHDYRDPTAFTRGHAMHNLTALMALDAVWRSIGG